MHTAPFRLMPTRLLSTMDVNQSTPAEVPPPEYKCKCCICGQRFTDIAVPDPEICPFCDEDPEDGIIQ